MALDSGFKRSFMALALLLPFAVASLRAADSGAGAGEDTDYRRAHHLYTLQEYKLAAESLTRYLAVYPKSERAEQALLLLAESRYQLKDFPMAAAQFELFLKTYPASARRADALQRAVKAHWQNRTFEKCIVAAETFLNENTVRLSKPDAPPALAAQFEDVLFYAGDACYGLKRPDAARGYWERLQKEFPKSALLPDAAEGLGWVAFDAGKFEEAQRQFALTAQKAGHPKAASSQLMLARALDGQGKSEAALAALDQAAALAAKSPSRDLARECLLWRAAIELKLKRYPEALQSFHALAKQFPEHAGTPVAVLQAAIDAERQAQPAAALDLSELYLADFNNGAGRPVAARCKARAFNALKKPAEALLAAQAALKEAEALPENSPEWQEQRPAALMLIGDLSGAQGLPSYEMVIQQHAQSHYALPARYQAAYLLGQEQKTKEALAHLDVLLKTLPAAANLPAAEKAELERKALFAAGDFSFRLEGHAGAEQYLQAYAALPSVAAEAAGGNAASAQLPLVWLRLAWCRHDKVNLDDALALLDKALATAPAALRPEALYLRARCRLEAAASAAPAAGGNACDQALADATALLKEAPESAFAAHAALEAAQALSKTRPADALAWLDQLLSAPLKPDTALRQEGLLLRARLRHDGGKQTAALADVKALLNDTAIRNELIPPAYLLQALCYEAQAGKAKDAEDAYSALLALRTDGKVRKEFGTDAPLQIRMALLRRARLRFQTRRWAEANADLAEYLKDGGPRADDPSSIEAAVLLGAVRKELKDIAGARKILEQAAALPLAGTLAFEVPFQLGNLAYEAGEFGAAVAQYKKALDAAAPGIGGKPALPLAAVSAAGLNLAWSYRRSGEPAKAAAAFGELLKLDPLGQYAAEARYQRGVLLADAGDTAAAMALWKELLEKQPEHALAEKALLALGQAQARASQFPAAVQDFEQYLKRYPKGESVREAWCGLAESRMQTQNPDGAREAFLKTLGEKGLEADLDDAGERALLGLAELALLKGEAGEAKRLALRIVIDRPGSKWLDAAYYFCARASEDLADPSHAIGYYRKLLEECPQSARLATARERLKALGAAGPAAP